MKKQGMLLTSISAILFGIIPLLTSLLYANGLNVVSVSFYRYAFMLPILLLLCWQRKLSLRITRKDSWYLFVLIALFSTATMLLLNSSYLYINTGVATTLHFLYPVLVIIICKYVYRDNVDERTRKSLYLISIGILCFFVHMKIDNVLGLVLALLSALTYAVYLVEMEKKQLSKLHPLVFSLYVSLYTSILLFSIHLIVPSLTFVMSEQAFMWLCVLSMISIVALVCLQQGSKHIGAKLTSLFSLFEPVTSLVIGVFILQEELTIWKISGCIFIFVAVLYLAMAKEKKEYVFENKEIL